MVLPSNSLISRVALRHTSLKAVFTRSILANGDGIEVISFFALAPSGSSIVSLALELYGNAGLSFHSRMVDVPSRYSLNTFKFFVKQFLHGKEEHFKEFVVISFTMAFLDG